MTRLPLRTRKKSSVSACECQTNSPFTFTTITSCPLNCATILGDQCSENAESFSLRLMAVGMVECTPNQRRAPGVEEPGMGEAELFGPLSQFPRVAGGRDPEIHRLLLRRPRGLTRGIYAGLAAPPRSA